MRRSLLLVPILLVACGQQGGSESDTGTDGATIANPASEYCIEQGGTLDIVDEADGQVGYCVLPDGTRIEEWELYRSSPGSGTDTGTDPDAGWDDFPADEAREEARGFLGMNEQDLPPEVRIARRGDETFALTEDYVLGRVTVELDDEGEGYRVTSLVVELPDGPETFELEPS